MNESDDPGRRDLLAREAWKWVLHLTSGDATKADIATLERWCGQSERHAEAFAKASGAWRSFGPAAESAARASELLPMKSRGGAAERVSRRAVLGGAALASAAGVTAFAVAYPPFDLWPSFNELTADYSTSAGEQRKINLAARVSVEMNTRTSLDIRSTNAHTQQLRLIAGEAIIATQSRPVEVAAGAGRVLADDAEFNVRCERSAVTVTCLAGTVQVERDRASLRLQQNEQISYSTAYFGTVSYIDRAVVMGWQQGDLYFRDQPLASVIDEVNRYRRGRIILLNAALRERRITAHFKINRLGVIITQLRETFGARVTALPGGVTLVT